MRLVPLDLLACYRHWEAKRSVREIGKWSKIEGCVGNCWPEINVHVLLENGDSNTPVGYDQLRFVTWRARCVAIWPAIDIVPRFRSLHLKIEGCVGNCWPEINVHVLLENGDSNTPVGYDQLRFVTWNSNTNLSKHCFSVSLFGNIFAKNHTL
jgi:hypothetical protein